MTSEEVEQKFQQIDDQLEGLGDRLTEFREHSLENTQNILSLQSMVSELADVVRNQSVLISALWRGQEPGTRN